MKKTVSRLSVRETAKIFTLLYGLFGVIAGIVFFFMMLSDSLIGAVAMLIAAPLIYAACGYLGTAFFCWLYNIIAEKFNTGITFEIKDAE